MPRSRPIADILYRGGHIVMCAFARKNERICCRILKRFRGADHLRGRHVDLAWCETDVDVDNVERLQFQSQTSSNLFHLFHPSSADML